MIMFVMLIAVVRFPTFFAAALSRQYATAHHY
jgi:hypothetical protein